MKTLREVRIEVAGYDNHLTQEEIDEIAKVFARQVAESVKAEAAKIAFEGVDVEYNITFMDIEKFIK